MESKKTDVGSFSALVSPIYPHNVNILETYLNFILNAQILKPVSVEFFFLSVIQKPVPSTNTKKYSPVSPWNLFSYMI